MNKIRKYILAFLTTLISYSLIFSQSNSGLQDTLIRRVHYKIIKRYDNNKVKEVGQFERTSGHSYNDRFVIIPDSLFDFSVKQGTFILFDQNGNELKQKYYRLNKRKNRKILGLKNGWWYDDNFCWYAYYFLGLELTSTQWQPDF